VAPSNYRTARRVRKYGARRAREARKRRYLLSLATSHHAPRREAYPRSARLFRAARALHCSRRMTKPIAITIALACALGACSSAPPPEEHTADTDQAICANRIRPGCGDCVPDPSSSTGYSKVCWNCDERYTIECQSRAPVPSNPSAYADPAYVGVYNDASVVHYSVTVPSGCVLQGSLSAYQGSTTWLSNVDLVPPGNGVGWMALQGLHATTDVVLKFWCSGSAYDVSTSTRIVYAPPN
jgi:hypothetical protein